MKFFLLTLLTVFCISAAHAEISKEKRKEVERMLQLTGMEKLADQMINQLISSRKAQMPDVPEAVWTNFLKKVNTCELIEKLIPIYDKHYSIEDLKAINAFYESPVGQKIILTLPQISQESLLAGQEWGQKIAKQIDEESKETSKKKINR